MDKMIQDLFKKTDKDYVNITNHYIDKITKNVKTRGGKMVTGREMNEIYQEGGFYHYLGTEHTSVVNTGVNNAKTPIFVIQTRDAPGTYGFGNDSGATISTPDVVDNTLVGDSPTLSYGINNTPCAGTNSQCVNTSECTVSYEVKQPKTFFSKIWGYLDDTSKSFNDVSETKTVTRSCESTQTGGGRPQKKIPDEDFNNLINAASFKMPKYQRVQFKTFIEHLINQ